MNQINVGTKVLCEGFSGRVVEVCSWNTELIVVQLASGQKCIAKSVFDGRYDNCKVL